MLDYIDLAAKLPMNREELCQLAYSFRSDPKIIGALMILVVLSSLTTLVIYFLWKSREMRRIWNLIDLDLKILVFVGAICYLIGALNSLLFYAYKLITLLLNFEPCFYVWPGKTCFMSQNVFTSACVMSYTLLHFGLLLERLYVAFLNRRGKYKGICGAILAVFILVIVPIPQSSFIQSSMYDADRAYCSGLYTKIDKNIVKRTYSVVIFDFFVSTADFLLYLYNKRQMKLHKKRLHKFNLENTFKLRSMEISTSIIYPFSIVHSVTFCLQMFAFALFINDIEKFNAFEEAYFNEYVSFARSLANLILVTFLYTYVKWKFGKKRSVSRVENYNEGNVYFEQFQKMIS